RCGRPARRRAAGPRSHRAGRGGGWGGGPPPPFPHEVEKYEDWPRRRLDVLPGLTGLWQVSGRSNLTFDEMALLDIWYIENWSIGLDVKLMFRTVPAVLLGTGAY